jgi:hypothetical protein
MRKVRSPNVELEIEESSGDVPGVSVLCFLCRPLFPFVRWQDAPHVP